MSLVLLQSNVECCVRLHLNLSIAGSSILTVIDGDDPRPVYISVSGAITVVNILSLSYSSTVPIIKSNSESFCLMLGTFSAHCAF